MNRSAKIAEAARRRDVARGGEAPPVRRPTPRRVLPCVHEGAVLEFCNTCHGSASELKHVRDCDVHDRCTRGPNKAGVASCVDCPDYDNGQPKPVITRPPVKDLAPGEGGFRFNPGLVEFGGRVLMAYRTGWYGSNVAISEVLPDGGFGPYRVIDLTFPGRAGYGREDPRLFVHAGKLHVSYIGVSGQSGPTHQMYARLSDSLDVEANFYAHYEYRRDWEKNWTFFSHDGTLYAVYDVRPHTVLKVDGGRTEKVHETGWSPTWTGGHMRGGASPVRVGDEYWCWFHGRLDPQRKYSVGVYAFEAAPPFRPTRYTPEPLHWADKKSKPKDQYVAVTFPGGAILRDGKWTVACGLHDRWVEFHEYDHAAVDRALVRA